MRKQTAPEAWAVFMVNHKGLGHGTAAVCGGDEWDAMQLAQPGRYTLIQGEIANEGVAERLARSHSSAQTRQRPKFDSKTECDTDLMGAEK